MLRKLCIQMLQDQNLEQLDLVCRNCEQRGKESLWFIVFCMFMVDMESSFPFSLSPHNTFNINISIQKFYLVFTSSLLILIRKNKTDARSPVSTEIFVSWRLLNTNLKRIYWRYHISTCLVNSLLTNSNTKLHCGFSTGKLLFLCKVKIKYFIVSLSDSYIL